MALLAARWGALITNLRTTLRSVPSTAGEGGGGGGGGAGLRDAVAQHEAVAHAARRLRMPQLPRRPPLSVRLLGVGPAGDGVAGVVAVAEIVVAVGALETHVLVVLERPRLLPLRVLGLPRGVLPLLDLRAQRPRRLWKGTGASASKMERTIRYASLSIMILRSSSNTSGFSFLNAYMLFIIWLILRSPSRKGFSFFIRGFSSSL